MVKRGEKGMKRRYKKSVCVLLFVLIFSTACGSADISNKSASSVYGNAGNDLYYEEIYESESSESYTSSEELAEGEILSDNRKLIMTVDMDAETYEFDTLVAKIENKVSKLGGYMEYTSVHTNYNDLKYGDFKIRVPYQRMDEFVSEVAQISNITSKNTKQDDVTLTYVDMESHKVALEAEETSLLALLEKAASIEDIITIQSRLTDVRYQIESMESQLRTMDNLVNYGTINLYIEEVESYTVVNEPSMAERISEGFKSSLASVGNGFKNVFLFLVINSPFLVVWGVIIALGALFVRFLVKKIMIQEKKKEEKRRNEQMNIVLSMPPYAQANVPHSEIKNNQQNGQEDEK